MFSPFYVVSALACFVFCAVSAQNSKCNVNTPDPATVQQALNTSTGNPAGCATKYFPQLLDHSAPNGTTTFLQQFQVIDTYYRPGGPILFLQGDESPIFCLEILVLPEYAQELGALVVQLEHRYFGLSCPYGLNYSDTTSWPVSDLQPLTWQNVLADTIYFLNWLKKEAYPSAADAPVIAVSGSYGALLTSMLRVHYPDCIYGVISSSLPSLAVSSDPNSPVTFTYATWANTVYYDVSVAAANKIKQAVSDFRYRMASGSFNGLQEALGLCSAPNATDQVDAIVYQMLMAYTVILQYNEWPKGYPFDQVINATLALNDSMAILNAALTSYNEFSGSTQNCTDWTAPLYPGVDPFLYIRCTFFPYPDAFSLPDSIWGPNLPNFTQQHLLDEWCLPIFNITSADGGLPQQRMLGVDLPTIEATERILITAGTFDPAASFEPRFLPNPNRNGSRVWYVDRASHTADLLSANETDGQGLIETRAMTLNTLKEWLGYQE